MADSDPRLQFKPCVWLHNFQFFGFANNCLWLKIFRNLAATAGDREETKNHGHRFVKNQRAGWQSVRHASRWLCQTSLPRNLKGSLPTVAEIEAELDNARNK
jgi:hypothetical protein